jgi:hypothetical protein
MVAFLGEDPITDDYFASRNGDWTVGWKCDAGKMTSGNVRETVELPYIKRDVIVDYVSKSTCQTANKPAGLTSERGAETRKCYYQLLCEEIIAECEVSSRHERYHAHNRRWSWCLLQRWVGAGV